MKVSATDRMRLWEAWGQSWGRRQGSAAGSGCSDTLRGGCRGASCAHGAALRAGEALARHKRCYTALPTAEPALGLPRAHGLSRPPGTSPRAGQGHCPSAAG